MVTEIKKVSIIGLNFQPETTGIAPYTSGLAIGLAASGDKITLITTQPHYPAWRIQKSNLKWRVAGDEFGVGVVRVLHYVPRKPTAVKRVLSELSFAFRAVCQNWDKPQSIIFVSPSLISTAASIIKASLIYPRAKRIVWVQDLYSRGLAETNQGGTLARKIFFKIEKFVMDTADKIVVIHEGFAGTVKSDFEIPMQKIAVVRNWTHIPIVNRNAIDVEAVREVLGWASGEIIVLHTGNMGRKQGLENVVKAAELARIKNLPIKFVLLGDGSESSKLKSMSFGNPKLMFMDPVGEYEYGRMLVAANVLLVNELPGLSQMAVPSKLTSYFASGVPVVAACSADGITASEIYASGAGWVVEPGRPEILLAQISEILSSPSQMGERGANGKVFFSNLLKEEVAIARFIKLLSN